MEEKETDSKIYKDENGEEYEIVTHKQLFDEAEEKMFMLKSESVDYLYNLLTNNDLDIRDNSDLMEEFLDLCAGKSSYIDIEIQKSIQELEEDEELYREELEENN